MTPAEVDAMTVAQFVAFADFQREYAEAIQKAQGG